MHLHIFLQQYANTPLKDRPKAINKDGLTLNKIREQVIALEDKISPYKIEQDKLLREADWYYVNKK